ncbi:choice-of-anchor O protein [Kaarinaea lacus]
MMSVRVKILLVIILFSYTPILWCVEKIDLSPPLELSVQTPNFDGAYKSKIVRTSSGVLVVVYGDSVENDPQHYVFDTKLSSERPARDIFVTICDSANSDCSLSNNWSTPINIANTASLSSIQTDWNNDGVRTDYFGDSDNPHVFASGSHVVVTWGDKYCPEDQQRSVTYLEFDSREIPMSCVYAAHTSQDYEILSSWTVDRLSDGSRDVKQDNNKGLSSGVWVITWQEDPLGLQPGEAEGPGEGSSGAKVSHGTDIWYTYTSNVSNAVSDIGVWKTPVRITDNHTEFGLPGSFNPIKNTAGNSVDPSLIEKGRVGASRANLQVVGGSSPPNTVIAYEETKGSMGLDEGKFLRYHVFPYNSPPSTTIDKAGCIVSDPSENARRARFVAQTNAASGSGIRFALFWRQGLYNQGGPADVMMRIGYKTANPLSTGLHPSDLDPPVDVNCFALDYDSAVNLTNAAPLNVSSNTLQATEANLADATDANFLENSRAHRAVLRANDLYLGYIYTDDWAVAEATDLANYNFFVRRFNAMNGVWSSPINLSNITDTTINVREPRLIGTPGNGPGCTDPDNITNPANCQNKSVVVAAWGTETNTYGHIGGREYLDIFITRTTDKAAHFEPIVNLASGPANQGESQIRVTPDGNNIFAVWNETNNGQTDSMFSAGTPVTLFSDMAISISTTPTEVLIGNNIDITYNVENLGPERAYGIYVTITLPASVEYLSASDFCTYNTSNITCQLGDIDANNNVSLGISVQTSIAETLDFTATISSELLDDSDMNNNQVQSSVNVLDVSDIALTLTSSEQNVDIGSNSSLLYQLKNNGPSDVQESILVLDLPDGATFIGSTPALCSESNSDISCDIGALDNGELRSVTIDLRIDVSGPITIDATASSNQFDPDDTNNTTSVTKIGIPNINLALSGTVRNPDVTEGSYVYVNFTVKNNGPQQASGVIMQTVLPKAWIHNSASSTKGSCNTSGSHLTCNVDILAADEAFTVELVGTVNHDMEVDIRSNVAATENDLDDTNNATSVHIVFKNYRNMIERTFGCAMIKTGSESKHFDPTLLLILLFVLSRLLANKLRARSLPKNSG